MKKTKPLRKKLIAKLDKLWSMAVRARYPKCVVCGSENTLSSHHCIVRKAQSLGVRWIVDNGVTLCYSDHICKLHGPQGGDKQFMDRYIAILNDLISADRQQEIIDIGHRINKFSTFDLQNMVKDFEAVKNVTCIS